MTTTEYDVEDLIRQQEFRAPDGTRLIEILMPVDDMNVIRYTGRYGVISVVFGPVDFTAIQKAIVEWHKSIN